MQVVDWLNEGESMKLCMSRGFAGPDACVLDAGHAGQHEYGDIAEALAEQQRKDADRYRWLRDRYAAADFQWGEHRECVLVFEWPEECSVSGNCDATIDAAMLNATTDRRIA